MTPIDWKFWTLAGVAAVICLFAQTPPAPPCIAATPYLPAGYIAAPSITASSDPAGVVHFTCYNLAAVPALAAALPNCIGTVPLPQLVLGAQGYYGVGPDGTLVTQSPINACIGATSPCAPSASPSAGIGGYDIALYTQGAPQPWRPLWTGAPALPQVNVIGCTATVSYAPGQITVTCNGGTQ